MHVEPPTVIPTEPIGSIPRPLELIRAAEQLGYEAPELAPMYERAIKETINALEATGSPVVTDGEQRKHQNFWTYSVHGLENTTQDGFAIPFSAGHTRRMTELVAGPFRYKRRADRYLDVALRYTHVPVKARIETADEVRDRLLLAAEYIPVAWLGSTDDRGFSSSCDDVSTSREITFEKIRRCVEGTATAEWVLGLR